MPKKQNYLAEIFTGIVKTIGWTWLIGIILTFVFVLVFRFWTKSFLIPLLFILGVATRIPSQQFPIHRMFEIITISSIIIALQFSPFIAFVFAISAFLISRLFGPVEDPTLTVQLGLITGFIAFLAPVLAPEYTFLTLIFYLNVARVLIYTAINFLIVKKVSIFFIQIVWTLVVGVGFNYALALFILKQGWV